MKKEEEILVERKRIFKEMIGLEQTSENVTAHRKLRAMITALNWVLLENEIVEDKIENI